MSLRSRPHQIELVNDPCLKCGNLSAVTLNLGLQKTEKEYVRMQNTGNAAILTTPRSAGYTLAELAICLCIIGILTSGGLLGTSHYFKGEKKAQTRPNIAFPTHALRPYDEPQQPRPQPAEP